MPRQYQVFPGDSTEPQFTYTGIDRDFTSPIRLDDWIGIVRVNGEPECWRLDSPAGSQEVVRYYADQGFIGARCMVLCATGWHSEPAVASKDIHIQFR